MKLWRRNACYWNQLESEKQGKRITHCGRAHKGWAKLSKAERKEYVSPSEESGQQ